MEVMDMIEIITLDFDMGLLSNGFARLYYSFFPTYFTSYQAVTAKFSELGFIKKLPVV
jgi:hypothetical protein